MAGAAGGAADAQARVAVAEARFKAKVRFEGWREARKQQAREEGAASAGPGSAGQPGRPPPGLIVLLPPTTPRPCPPCPHTPDRGVRQGAGQSGRPADGAGPHGQRHGARVAQQEPAHGCGTGAVLGCGGSPARLQPAPSSLRRLWPLADGSASPLPNARSSLPCCPPALGPRGPAMTALENKVEALRTCLAASVQLLLSELAAAAAGEDGGGDSAAGGAPGAAAAAAAARDAGAAAVMARAAARAAGEAHGEAMEVGWECGGVGGSWEVGWCQQQYCSRAPCRAPSSPPPWLPNPCPPKGYRGPPVGAARRAARAAGIRRGGDDQQRRRRRRCADGGGARVRRASVVPAAADWGGGILTPHEARAGRDNRHPFTSLPPPSRGLAASRAPSTFPPPRPRTRGRAGGSLPYARSTPAMTGCVPHIPLFSCHPDLQRPPIKRVLLCRLPF
jgi:hypothetical protein